MAITAYPLNNIEYSAEDAMLMNLPISSGVFADDDHFAISLSGDFSATISAGLGFIRYDTAKGFTFYMDAEETVLFDEPDTVLSRIDRVVLRWDESKNGVSLAVKKGSPSSTPVAVERETNSSVYELVLYDITIAANATSISAANITDQKLNPALCGLMANNITSIDTAAINAQITALIAGQNTAIQNAVNDALQEAKESGDFKPVKGVDYWTESDKEEIVADVITNFTNVAEVGA